MSWLDDQYDNSTWAERVNDMDKKLRVWWIPQVPGDPFYVPVDSPEQAALILDTLAAYDRFEYDRGIKADYTNAGGLEEFDNGKWCEWYSEDGDDIDEWMEYGRKGE